MPSNPNIDSLLAADLAATDEVIRRHVGARTPVIAQAVAFLTSGGSARARPVLALLAARALGYPGDGHQSLAAAIELIHKALALHNQVQAANDAANQASSTGAGVASFGPQEAVLLGDLLYAAAFRVLVELGDMRIMSVVAKATVATSEGEVMHLSDRAGVVGLSRRIEVVRARKGSLFAATTRGAAMLAGAAGAEDALAAYGLHFGTARQLFREAAAGETDGDWSVQLGRQAAVEVQAAIDALADLSATPAKAALIALADGLGSGRAGGSGRDQCAHEDASSAR